MNSETPTENHSFLLNDLLGVYRHEYAAVAWSFAYFFCVLSSYYILRPVRDAMAVSSGPATIPYLFMGTFVVMMLATPIFGWVVSRFPRRIFLPWVYAFFASHLLIFWVIFSILGANVQEQIWLGRIFFVWLSVFNLFVVSVFWSFMADIYTREEGRRLFGLITAGGSLGALLGGAVTSLVVVHVGFKNLLPLAALILLTAIFCIRQLRQWVLDEHENDLATTVESERALGGSALSGVLHVMKSPYFMCIALTSVLASLLGTALYMFVADLIQTSIPNPDERTRFFSNMNIAQNFFALFAQMFLVKQVVERFGIGVALALMPVVSVAGFILLALDPVLIVAAVLTVVRRALGFGFTKPSTDMLYSVVSPEDKYKTKNFIDTAVYRGGDVVGTWSVKLMMGLGVAGVSVVMLPFAILWVFTAVWMGREYRRRASELKRQGVS